MLRYTSLALLICAALVAHVETVGAQTTNTTTYSIDLSHPFPAPITGQLKMGGKNPAGVEINANSQYLTLGGKPWVPVMGEFHFTRYPRDEWERELLKMKAGGVMLVSTYVFWIHHEEVQGQFDWTGDRDLRTFIQLCAKHGLLAWVRLGPWCHGEVRNGGLPDWVLAECGRNIRKNDPKFMGFTRTLYQQIFKQCDGLLWKDGGPIVGVQLENEMSNNPSYLLALKRLAQDVGFDVPLYSVTGWGSVKFPADEVIPLFGGYADGFWEGGSTYSKKDRKQFFFTHVRDDSGIGADLMPATWRAAQAAELDKYPYVTCECGGGMETSYARRPLMTAGDVAALSFVKIGSGSNLPGYYMYHGGRNPQGKRSTLQESQATGYPNDMPVIRYDFQAPLGEYGQVRESYDALRIIHSFLADYGEQLATMPSILPAAQPKSVDDKATLRWAARSDGHRGFVFIDNYQRVDGLPDRRDVQLTLKLAEGDLKLPEQPATVPSGTYTIWPFNMDLNGVTLRYATAQPLCRIDDDGVPCFVFFSPKGVDAEFDIDGVGVLHPTPSKDFTTTVHAADGRSAKILLLTQEQAMHAYVAEISGKRRLIISPDGNAIVDGDSIEVEGKDPTASIWIYPRLTSDHGTPVGSAVDGVFVRYSASATRKAISIDPQQITPAGPARAIVMGPKKKPMPPSDADFDQAATWHIAVPKDAPDGVQDVLLRVNFSGDVARAYVGDKLVDDHFFFGEPWEIGLRRFAPEVLEKGLTIKILPLRKDLPVYLPEDHRPTFDEKGEALQLNGIEAVPVYSLKMTAAAR